MEGGMEEGGREGKMGEGGGKDWVVDLGGQPCTKSLTSHQEPGRCPRDPVGIAGDALVAPAVAGDDGADLQGQVVQLPDSARGGRQDAPVPHPRQVVGGLSPDAAGQDGGLPGRHGHVGRGEQLRRRVCEDTGAGGSQGPARRDPAAALRRLPPAGRLARARGPPGRCRRGARLPCRHDTPTAGCVHACALLPAAPAASDKSYTPPHPLGANIRTPGNKAWAFN